MTVKDASSILKMETFNIEKHLHYIQLISKFYFNASYETINSYIKITRAEHLQALLSIAPISKNLVNLKRKFLSKCKELKEILSETPNIINSKNNAVRIDVDNLLRSQQIKYDLDTLSVIFESPNRELINKELLNIKRRHEKKHTRIKDNKKGYIQKTVDIPIETIGELDKVFSNRKTEYLCELYKKFIEMDNKNQKKIIEHVEPFALKRKSISINFKIEKDTVAKLDRIRKKHGITFKALTFAIINQKINNGISILKVSNQGNYNTETMLDPQRFGPCSEPTNSR